MVKLNNQAIQEQSEEYTRHIYYMGYALKEAQKALAKEEVPVGAVLVYQGEIVGHGFNQREGWQSPTAHAEMLAIQKASSNLRRWRLEHTTLYVTLEPCAMCAGAMVLARVEKVVFALRDPKAGACGSIFNIVGEARLNHRIKVIEGIGAEESQRLLQDFFQGQRKKPKYQNRSCETASQE